MSSHTAKLEAAGYLAVLKKFRGKMTVTSYRVTKEGREALEHYWASVRAALPQQAGG